MTEHQIDMLDALLSGLNEESDPFETADRVAGTMEFIVLETEAGRDVAAFVEEATLMLRTCTSILNTETMQRVAKGLIDLDPEVVRPLWEIVLEAPTIDNALLPYVPMSEALRQRLGLTE